MFKRVLVILATVFSFAVATPAALAENPHVLFNTSAGEIEIELNADSAPVTVKNFIDYVNSGFFDGTIFHRVIPGFMIQGGGFTADMNQKATNAPIKNEGNNGLKNTKGTLAMARTSAPNSATSQFFINLVDNDFLDYNASNPGYAVFGHVVKGMDIVEQIAGVETKNAGPHQNVPVTPITIISAKVM